jgi:hypothetical protein
MTENYAFTQPEKRADIKFQQYGAPPHFNNSSE